MPIYNSVFDLTGNTPLLRAKKFSETNGLETPLLVKLEYFNPAGSVKDRTVKSIIEQAEASGKLAKGATIIEPTSGNTGVALAAFGAAKGYKIIITMPENMSAERRQIIAAYGAEIILTDGAKGMRGAIEKAEELAASIPNPVIAGQFTNSANPTAHFLTTGPEIWNDTQGKIDIFVAGVGTGGTVSGAGEFLKSKKAEIQIVAIEPESSPVLTKGYAGAHKIQGIGAGFVPQVLNTEIFDEVIAVSDDDAFKTAKAFARSEGLLAGISSGAALYAAAVLAKRKENRNKNIVALLPDSGERYLSTGLFG